MISVLLTCYNASHLLKDSINSILVQSYKNFELIIIDDGSTDNTKEILESFSDSRINFETIKHVGRSGALNFGLSKCRYELIALMDADDISHPNRFEKQFDFLSNNENVSIVSCWYGVFRKKGKLKYIQKLPETDLEIKSEMKLSSPMCHSGTMIRKKVFLNHKYEDIPFEEYKLWIDISRDFTFHNIQETLLYVRETSNSISRENYIQKRKNIFLYQNEYFSKQNLKSRLNPSENYYIIGLRQLYYNSKLNARLNFRKMGIRIFSKSRAIFGFFLTYFHQSVIDKVLQFRLKNIIYTYLFKINEVKEFQKILKKLKN